MNLIILGVPQYSIWRYNFMGMGMHLTPMGVDSGNIAESLHQKKVLFLNNVFWCRFQIYNYFFPRTVLEMRFFGDLSPIY